MQEWMPEPGSRLSRLFQTEWFTVWCRRQSVQDVSVARLHSTPTAALARQERKPAVVLDDGQPHDQAPRQSQREGEPRRDVAAGRVHECEQADVQRARGGELPQAAGGAGRLKGGGFEPGAPPAWGARRAQGARHRSWSLRFRNRTMHTRATPAGWPTLADLAQAMWAEPYGR